MGRPLKRKKAILEKLIEQVWRSTNFGMQIKTDEQAIVLKAIAKTLEYFDTMDKMNDGLTIHAKIFSRMYLDNRSVRSEMLFEVADEFVATSENNKDKNINRNKRNRVDKKARENLALILNIDPKTLYRYTNNYMKCFELKLTSNGFLL